MRAVYWAPMIGFLVPILFPDCLQSQTFKLTDVSQSANVDFQHVDGSSGAHYLVEAISAGIATFDYDNDGDVDIYLLNGAALPGVEYKQAPVNRLFRNDGDMTFTDVTHQSGLGDLGYSLGVAAGDWNNDGYADVYITNFGKNSAYQNNGDGTFSRIDDPVLECGEKVGAGVTMLDVENDGDLDIYAASYIKFGFNMRPPSKFHGKTVYGGPVLYPRETDDLLRNNGDGTFTNISEEAGISEFAEWGMATLGFDADRDGDTDIFVANDSTQNFYWENDGLGNFTESGLVSGLAFDRRGEPQGSMGVDIADFNNDLSLDLFQTAYENQLATLYENLQGGFFQDSSLRTGAGAGTHHHVNWGLCFADIDNNGTKDLFLANGHIHDNLDEFNDNSSFKVKNLVYANTGRGKFVDVSSKAGTAMLVEESSRGMAADDLDGDGRIDFVIQNIRNSPTIIHNESTSGNYVQLRLIGMTSNRDAVGSQVIVRTATSKQILEVHSGRGYQSHYGSILHFGIGDETEIQEIEVSWIGNGVAKYQNIPINQTVTIVQGVGVPFP